MPYRLSTRAVKGKKKYCMTAIRTGKTYCYDSANARKIGMKMHMRYAGEWKCKIL